jgi:hypothetical protein
VISLSIEKVGQGIPASVGLGVMIRATRPQNLPDRSDEVGWPKGFRQESGEAEMSESFL